MSSIADNRQIINVVNQTTNTGIVLDMSDIDLVSISATYTPVSAGTGTLAAFESVDGVNYVAIAGLTVAISASGTTIWHINPIFSRLLKILYTATTNGMTLVVTMNSRNNGLKSDVYVLPLGTVVTS